MISTTFCTPSMTTRFWGTCLKSNFLLLRNGHAPCLLASTGFNSMCRRETIWLDWERQGNNRHFGSWKMGIKNSWRFSHGFSGTYLSCDCFLCKPCWVRNGYETLTTRFPGAMLQRRNRTHQSLKSGNFMPSSRKERVEHVMPSKTNWCIIYRHIV